jgi:hypothetical protein
VGRIETFANAQRACESAVECWAEHAAALGPAHAVMVARDNETREELNAKARELRLVLGVLGDEEIYGSLSLAVGDRVICRRNDRRHDVDNGMRGTVRHLDQERVVIDTDSGLVRELPAAYVEEHMEHAYALTGHGMQGGTVEAAVVVASPRDLSAGWSYTALSRARGETQLLIYEDRHQQERGEFSPRAPFPNPGRAELLARVERRMAQRDDEELAIQQLAGPGRPHDRSLSSARAVGQDVAQERAAIRAEPPLPVTAGIARLRDLREQTMDLKTQLQALPQRELQQIDDLDARTSILTTQREALADRVGELPRPRRRFGRTHDSHPVERANLQSAVQSADRELDAALTRRERLARELGDPAEIRSERESLEQALRGLCREQGRLRDQLAERELAQPGAWVRESFGERPTEARSRGAWEQDVRDVARYRLEYQLGASHDALGARREERAQRGEWERAQRALERSQRRLGQEVTAERDVGRDVGF